MAMVRCEVCGRTFNQSYLASHRRLAHGKRKETIAPDAGEDETIQTIVSLYEELSAEGRNRAIRLLEERTRRAKKTGSGD